MRRVAVTLLPALALTLVACRRESDATHERCDLAVVSELAKQLAAADPDAQVEMITTPPVVRTYCVYQVLYGPRTNGPQSYGPESYRPEGEVA